MPESSRLIRGSAAVERDDVDHRALAQELLQRAGHLDLLETVRGQNRHLQPLESLASHAPGVCTPRNVRKGPRDGAGPPRCCRTVDAPRAMLSEQLRTLGVTAGQVLLVHASFRTLRPVEGGPEGVLAALLELLGPEGTLVMPSWTGQDDAVFDPRTTPAATDLGVLADAFWRLPGVRRSTHPFAFAASGALAEEIVTGAMTLPPHAPGSPVDRVHARDGRVLLLGVGHDANTTLHLAEMLADVPYRVRNAIHRAPRRRADDGSSTGRTITAVRASRPPTDGSEPRDCSRKARSGNAPARLFRSRDVVRLAVEQLRREPLLFLHPAGAGCPACDEARASTVR